MSRADHEQRALKRELLLTRAAAERAQVVHHLDSIDTRTRGPRELIGFAMHGADRLRGSSLLATAATAVGLVRRAPWLAPVIFKAASKLVRSGPLGLGLAGAVALGAWWLIRSRRTTASSESDATRSAQE